MGRDLFDELRAAGGAAAKVSEELASVFRDDFERGMDQFWETHNEWSSELLRDMARYFSVFKPLGGNLYQQLLKILGGTRKKAVFATTNYDMLIEIAIRQAGLFPNYCAPPLPSDNIQVLKIHGSCNFLPNIPGQIRGGMFKVANDGAIFEGPVRIVESGEEVRDFCRREDAIAPSLAMYNPSKRVLYCPRFIRFQQDLFRSAIKNAARIYIIGLRVHRVDVHIWGALGNSKAPLYYVGGEPDDFHAWAAENNLRNARDISRSFEAALPVISRHLT